MDQQTAFQIHITDNVATALTEIENGDLHIRGDAVQDHMMALEHVPTGHKIAVKDIASGEDIVKYGIVIGVATQDIGKGQWVHLHVMRSKYDERSSHLDVVTGKPLDIKYE